MDNDQVKRAYGRTIGALLVRQVDWLLEHGSIADRYRYAMQGPMSFETGETKMAAPKYSPADDQAHLMEVLRHLDEGMKLPAIAKKMGLTRYRVTKLATEGERLRHSTDQQSVSVYPMPHTKADEKLLG